MIKKYALVSTSYWDGNRCKSFHILRSGLTEEEIARIKFYAEERTRLWDECYKQEAENAKNGGITVDLRTGLREMLNKPISEADIYTVEDYYRIWTEKDLIIERYEF